MFSVLRAIFGYLFLILVVRVASRRPGKQIAPFEFVMIFFMGGATLTAMVGDDRSFTNALIQITSIALTHSLLTWAKDRWPRLGLYLDGTPLLLLKRDEWLVDTMRHMKLQDDDVMAIARDQGLERLDQIEYAVLEYNGEISIVPRNDAK